MKAVHIINKLSSTLNEEVFRVEKLKNSIVEENEKVDNLVKQWVDGVREGEKDDFFKDLAKEITSTIDSVRLNINNIMKDVAQ